MAKLITSCTVISTALLFLIWSGCGIFSAPVSVPAAIASNANFSLRGSVVDVNGTPLDGVMLAQQLDHHFWTPIMGGTDTDEHHLRRIDKTYSVSERGRELKLTFSLEGFLTNSISFNAERPNTITTDFGDLPQSKDFSVVMIPAGSKNADLFRSTFKIDATAYPQESAIQLNPREGPLSAVVPNVEETAYLPPGLFYVTLTRESPKPLNSKGDVDVTEVNLPGKIILHIAQAGPDGGILQLLPRPGFAPIQTSDLAPESGYLPDLEISRTRLKEMRQAGSSRVIESREYFFFKSQNIYGKGAIQWSQRLTKDSREPAPAAFRISLWMQMRPGNRDLTAHDAQLPYKAP